MVKGMDVKDMIDESNRVLCCFRLSETLSWGHVEEVGLMVLPGFVRAGYMHVGQAMEMTFYN